MFHVSSPNSCTAVQLSFVQYIYYTRTLQGVSWLDYPTLPIGFQTGHPLEGPGIVAGMVRKYCKAQRVAVRTGTVLCTISCLAECST